MKIKYFLLFIVVCLISCERNNIPPHVKYAQIHIKEIKKNAYEKYGLVMIVEGGAFMNQINAFNLYFKVRDEKTIDEMRVLIVNLTNDILERINSDKESRKYLAEYPFEGDRLEIKIMVVDSQNKMILNPGSFKGKLASGSLKNNKIWYSIQNEGKPYLQKIYEESFQTALEKVESSQYLLKK